MHSSPKHHIAFWLAALAFFVTMGFSAVPTPLYPLYQQRDGISDLMVTVVFAIYAVGVVISLFLGGHLSDIYGRRRLLVPALLINVVAAAIFALVPGLAWLLVARFVSGISIGLTTATATSYLTELYVAHRGEAGARTAGTVATAGEPRRHRLRPAGRRPAGTVRDDATTPAIHRLRRRPAGAGRSARAGGRDRAGAEPASGLPPTAGRGSGRRPWGLLRRRVYRLRGLRGVRRVQLTGPELPGGNAARHESRHSRCDRVRAVRGLGDRPDRATAHLQPGAATPQRPDRDDRARPRRRCDVERQPDDVPDRRGSLPAPRSAWPSRAR